MVTKTFEGQLEVDSERGVIYFHSNDTGTTLMRICRLPTPIPLPEVGKSMSLDISHMVGTDWIGEERIGK